MQNSIARRSLAGSLLTVPMVLVGCGDSREGEDFGASIGVVSGGSAGTGGGTSDPGPGSQSGGGGGEAGGDGETGGGGSATGGGVSATGGSASASAGGSEGTGGASAAESGTGGGSGNTSGDGGSSSGTGVVSCQDCPSNYICKYDACIPDLGTCSTHDDCPGDSYCDDDGQCIPYGVPEDKVNDPDCEKPVSPAGITPVLQCEWTGTGTQNVYTAPMVADLNLDQDPDRLQPSIVLTMWAQIDGSRTGTLRVFDGRTCEQQIEFGGVDDPDVDDHRPGYASQWAIADLDGDVPTGGHPEIVGFQRRNDVLSVYALGIDMSGGTPELTRMWHGRDCANGNDIVTFGHRNGHFGPSVIDLDDDGVPEVVADTMVFRSSDGCLLNSDQDETEYLGDKGIQSAVVDVDLDGLPDLVRHDRVAGWDQVANAWVTKPDFINDAGHLHGYVAVVDAGLYSTGVVGVNDADLPEVVVVSASSQNANSGDTGSIRLQTLTGDIVWGPVPLYQGSDSKGGRGGPPTASDFDGDGWPEFASAGSTYYGVYDPDCVDGGAPERVGGTCNRSQAMSGLPDDILWAQTSNDDSSNITGSSVFDFDGDGDAEVVYADECYVRVYDGSTGEVVFSAPAGNGTGMEYPVIADVDGDFATEIIVPRASNGPNCASPDPLYPDSGAHTESDGFAVLRDPQDLWANSRPIWNQHAYSVTHVEDNGVVPASSATVPNWLTEGLNNFRQNAQGQLGALKIADLTVELSDALNLCSGQAGTLDLQAEVCNRGTAPVQDGVTVEFYEAGTPVCTALTNKLQQPGDCEIITCQGDLTGTGDISVIVDPEGSIADCHPGNNDGASSLQICPQ